ncbi:MAG: hypothetical protein LQ346_008009 [Caloplaca aetnensis]|nr:MAG: hypothetical protein LQ346_008009 [Caloplaca aetnensis]
MTVFFKLALAAFALLTSAYAASPYNAPPYIAPPYNALQILCYDARYATHKPELGDCAAIIGHSIAKPPIAARVRKFARRPARYQLALPHTWRTEKGECNVTIDMPPVPGETGLEVAEASMLEIKRAAFEIFLKCVAGADHLGGLMQTGKNMDLQVRVEAGDGTA